MTLFVRSQVKDGLEEAELAAAWCRCINGSMKLFVSSDREMVGSVMAGSLAVSHDWIADDAVDEKLLWRPCQGDFVRHGRSVVRRQ